MIVLLLIARKFFQLFVGVIATVSKNCEPPLFEKIDASETLVLSVVICRLKYATVQE